MSRTRSPILTAFAVTAALLLALPCTARAHGGSELVISLDGDPDLKKAVIEAVQQFLGTKANPISFSVLNGLVAANMDEERSLVVLVDHTDFGVGGVLRIAGMKDGALEQKLGPPRAEDECQKVADSVLAQVPRQKRDELHMLVAPVLDGGLYIFTWRRMVNGIPVLGNEAFNVGVNAHTAKVVFWELLIFDFPADMIEVSPAISPERAVHLAQQTVLSEDKKEAFLSPRSRPKLVIVGRQANWAVLLNIEGRSAPVWSIVDGKSGKVDVHWRGPIAGELREIFGNVD